MEAGLDLFGHVEVLIPYRDLDGALAVFRVEELFDVEEGRLPRLHYLGAVVAEYVFHRRVLGGAGDIAEVIEALVALGIAGGLAGGEHGVELAGDEQSVYHDVLRGAGMHVEAVDLHADARGVEVFVLDDVLLPAVDGVGELGAEMPDVEVVGAPADLLVRREGHEEPAVRDVFIDNALGRAHYLRYAGLVVRAEQRRAVGDDERAAPEVFRAT